MLRGQTLLNAALTFACSCVSLTGSVLIGLSYLVARTRSTPKNAFLILHLAASDFFWFLSGAVLSFLWLFNDGKVPAELCFLASPIISFTRMASLIWTVVISFNLLMSVQKRKWFWKSQEEDWERYRKRYFAIIFLLATPGTLLSIINQHSQKEDASSLGCSPGYEPLGMWYEIFFTELLPISAGFLVNLYVLLTVRHKMSKTAFPQSVRKRRKRVMYHYTIVCILCWIPTIVQYLMEISGVHSSVLEIVARTSLYASGALNFLVFGMQDPHLKRSFDLIVSRGWRACCCSFVCCMCCVDADEDNSEWSRASQFLKASDVDKTVMFEEKTICKNADLSKDKKAIYRNRKLSREDKILLYQQRPDLNPRFKCAPAPEGKLSSRSGSHSSISSAGSASSSGGSNASNARPNALFGRPTVSPLQQQQSQQSLTAVCEVAERGAARGGGEVSECVGERALAVHPTPRGSDDIQMSSPLLEHQTIHEAPLPLGERESESDTHRTSSTFSLRESENESAQPLLENVPQENESLSRSALSSPVKEFILPRRLTGGGLLRDRDLEAQDDDDEDSDTASSSDEADEEDDDLNAL